MHQICDLIVQRRIAGSDMKTFDLSRSSVRVELEREENQGLPASRLQSSYTNPLRT